MQRNHKKKQNLYNESITFTIRSSEQNSPYPLAIAINASSSASSSKYLLAVERPPFIAQRPKKSKLPPANVTEKTNFNLVLSKNSLDFGGI